MDYSNFKSATLTVSQTMSKAVVGGRGEQNSKTTTVGNSKDLNVVIRRSSTAQLIQKVGTPNNLYFAPNSYNTMQIIAKMYNAILEMF